MRVTLEPANLSDRDVVALVAAHGDLCDAPTPPESRHRLGIEALAAPDLTVWAARDAAGALVGMGALRRLSAEDGEIKSMHTPARVRGLGIARQILAAILDEARRTGLRTLWLETGTHADFAPARALYASAGFVPCPPFGVYVSDPHSVFMRRPVLAREVSA